MSTSDGRHLDREHRANAGGAVPGCILLAVATLVALFYLSAGNHNCAGPDPLGTQRVECAQELSAREIVDVQD